MMIKKIITYLLLAFIVFGCSESTFDATRTPALNRRYLNANTSELFFSSAASTKSADIESDATPWKISVPASWITVTPSTGNISASVEFSAQQNNSADTSRVCVAEISSNVNDWSRSFPITITQEKASAYIEFENTSLTTESKEQTLNVGIICNTGYSISNNAEEWLHVSSQSANGMTLNVDENNTDNERYGVICIKSKTQPNASSTLTIRQKKANITSSLEIMQFGHNSSTQNVKIESGASWKATNSAWLTVSPSSGNAGITTVIVTAAKNASSKDREGSVYFTIAGANSVELPIKQEGVKLTTSKKTLSFESFSNTQILDISSNDEWSITEKPEWVTISDMSGNGNKSVNVTVTDNSSTTTRQGKINVCTKDNVVSQQIVIIQSAKNVDCADTLLSYGYAAGSQSFTFTTDASWTIVKDQDWISVDKYSGSGNAILTISVEENKSSKTRLGVITLHIADLSYTITIAQDCKMIEINSSAFAFAAAASSSTLSISSNTQWKVSVTEGSDWLYVSPEQGSHSADLSISVKENNTISSRTGEVIVEIPEIRSYKVSVTQNRKYIKTDMTSVDFGSAGGQISFTVSSDGAYEVERIGNWFGFIRNGDVITAVSPQNSTGTSRSGAIILKLNNLTGGDLSILVGCPVCRSKNALDYPCLKC